MPEICLVSISEAARRAGVSRTTVQNWIKARLLEKHPGDKVDDMETAVLSFRKRRRGRPCGVKEARREDAMSEVEAWAGTFLTNGVRGLNRLEKVLLFIYLHYREAGRADAVTEVLESVSDSARQLHERYGDDPKRPRGWRNPVHWHVSKRRKQTPEERRLSRQPVTAAMLDAIRANATADADYGGMAPR